MNDDYKPVANTTIKKILYLPILWLVSIALLAVGTTLGFTTTYLKLIESLKASDAFNTAEMYLEFWGIWVVVLLFCLIPINRPIYKAIKKNKGNTFKNLGIGLLVGFAMNGFCALCALLNGDIHLYFDSFKPISFILIFICVFIQSSAEELICRVFLYQHLKRAYKSPLVWIIGNSILFGLLHLGNKGIGLIPILNVTLSGILFSLFVYYFDSPWCAFACHTAWNFTQNIIFGLPNSGNVVPYSVFKLSAVNGNITFIYNPYFGIEGAALSCVVLVVAIVITILIGRKKDIQTENIWK